MTVTLPLFSLYIYIGKSEWYYYIFLSGNEDGHHVRQNI